MDTVAPPCAAVHHTLTIATSRPTAFVDLTDQLSTLVAGFGIRAGILNVQTRHTTTAIVVNEHEPLLLSDFESFLDRLAPASAPYRHDDGDLRVVNVVPGERSNGHAHCRALVLPSATSVNVADGRLQLGRWQRVFLVELDGPRTRQVSVLALGEFESPR